MTINSERFEQRRNEDKQFNGNGTHSGGYPETFNVKVFSNSRTDTVYGGRTTHGLRDATDFDRIVWTLLGDHPSARDTRNTLPGYAGGNYSTKYPSTMGFHFVTTLSQEDFLAFENEKSKARTQALNGFSGKDALQLGASIGEAKQTFGMFAQNAGQLARALTAAKHGRWGSIPAALGMSKRDVLTGKFPANRWLEYQYGWKPLKQDLYTGYERLTKQMVNKQFITSTGSGKVVINRPLPNGAYGGIQTGSCGVRVKLVACLVSSTAFGLQKDGLANPLSIAWELSPFSFVLDWFIPIGNVLNAMTGPLGLSFEMGFETWNQTLTNNWVQLSGDQHTTSKGSMEERWKRFSRGRRASFPLPELYADKNPFRGARALNALALMRGLLR